MNGRDLALASMVGLAAIGGLAARRGSRATGVDRVQVRAICARFETWKRRVIRAAGDDPDETEFDPNVYRYSGEQLARALKVPVLGTGAGRVVVRVAPGLVAKLPWNAEGIEQNEGEIASWDEAGPEVQRWMLPPLDYVSPPGVSIFPEARTCGASYIVVRDGIRVIETSGALALAKKEWEDLVRVGAAGANTEDAIKTENWGEYEGRLVLLDYAPDNE